MPSIAVHYICGNLVACKLNINSHDYLKGNLYPDYIDKRKHYRIQGKKFEVPNINRFMKEEKCINKFFKAGFLAHLMLDKLFLDDFVIHNIYTKIDEDINIFENDKIYKDYTNISERLLEYYHFSLDDIDDLMLSDSQYIDIEKYKNNINVIRESTSEDLNYIDFNSFIPFLEEASDQIYTYIKKEKIL